MLATPENINLVLPFGEMLRSFLEQPFISRGDLKTALRNRGIVVGSSDKEVTIPLATCCLLAPLEFGHLKECQSSREDNPKRVTRYLDWNSPDTLINSIPDVLDIGKLLKEVAPYCEVRGSPTFIPVGNDPNHIRLDFMIDRQDLSKSWATTNDVFKGSIALEKIYDGKTVKILLTHTADETRQLNIVTSKTIKRHLESTGRIPSGSEEQRILFNDFTNESRVQFLLSLSGDNGTNILTFSDVVDFDVCPDEEAGTLPSEINWMDRKVEELKLKGKHLHETVFIKEKKYHKYLHLHKICVKYDFNYHAAAGTCIISFGFEGFLGEAGKKAEFESNISSLTLKADFRNVNKLSVKDTISRAIELFTLEQYQRVCGAKSPGLAPALTVLA